MNNVPDPHLPDIWKVRNRGAKTIDCVRGTDVANVVGSHSKPPPACKTVWAIAGDRQTALTVTKGKPDDRQEVYYHADWFLKTVKREETKKDTSKAKKATKATKATKKSTSPLASRPDEHNNSAESAEELAALVAVSGQDTDDENTAPSCVKSKLASLCKCEHVQDALDQAAFDMNIVIAEAYAFANLHLSRLLDRGLDLPHFDRNYFYRCIAAVTISGCKAGLLDKEFLDTRAAFEALRPEGQRPINAMGPYMYILPDISVTMATMATNHLWSNLETRVKRYLCWAHPKLKKLHHTIFSLGLQAPNVPLEKVDKFSAVNADGEPKGATALEYIEQSKTLVAWLRTCGVAIPAPGKKRFATRARSFVHIYHDIMVATEDELEERRGDGYDCWDERFKGRRFSLLPTKQGFTIAHIPICSRAVAALVSDMRCAGGGLRVRNVRIGGIMYPRLRTEEPSHQQYVWKRFFSLSKVTTKTRQFGGSITTDGVAVSVLLAKKRALVQSSECEPWSPELLQGRIDAEHAGVDPGGNDIVTVCYRKTGAVASYSSKRFQTVAKYRESAKRVNRWNRGTADLVHTIVKDVNLSRTSGLEANTRSYLAVLRPLLTHRASKGYRNMRFSRYVGRQKAIEEVCDLIAPKKKGSFTVVGFGDWAGFGTSPISRECAGPLQAIKRRLRERSDTCLLRKVWEYRTSVTCHYTLERLVNMKATSTVRNRATGALEQRPRRRIHKVLHRKTGAGRHGGHETTWNRDVNAARNILMLLMLELLGMPRPMEFCKQLAERRR